MTSSLYYTFVIFLHKESARTHKFISQTVSSHSCWHCNRYMHVSNYYTFSAPAFVSVCVASIPSLIIFIFFLQISQIHGSCKRFQCGGVPTQNKKNSFQLFERGICCKKVQRTLHAQRAHNKTPLNRGRHVSFSCLSGALFALTFYITRACIHLARSLFLLSHLARSFHMERCMRERCLPPIAPFFNPFLSGWFFSKIRL